MMTIDAHQHFWEYGPEKHSWIGERMRVLKRDFMPPDLKREMDRAGVSGSVAVQASQSEAETEFLLGLARENDFVRGVVGWLDIRADDFEEKLDRYVPYEAFKGLRHIVQDEPDEKFLLQADFLEGMETIGRYELTYDILIYSRQLPAAVKFASRFPDQKFVVDHLAKPEIGKQELAAWEKGIRELAEHPGMHCKVSGMVTEADWQNWEAGEIKPYLDVVFEAFGTGRLMFGSDWPVCLLAAGYAEVLQLLEEYIRPLPEEEQRLIMGGTAREFYDL